VFSELHFKISAYIVWYVQFMQAAYSSVQLRLARHIVVIG